MIIINNTKSPIATTHETKRYTLKPGVNDVPPEVWEAWRATKVMKHYLDEGLIKEPATEDPEAPALQEATTPNLSKLSINKSIELVRATLDQELLESWIDGEGREKVLKAIERQLEKIAIKKPADAPAGDDNSDDTEGDDEPAADDKSAS